MRTSLSAYNLPRVSLFPSVCGQGAVPGRTDRRPGAFTVLASLQRGAAVGGPGSDSLRAGLADQPEDWPAACDAAAVITREPESRRAISARNIKCRMKAEGLFSESM